MKQHHQKKKGWKEQLHEVIYESNTVAGKTFDVALLIAIVLSILIVMLDSVTAYHDKYGDYFIAIEWGFTILFTIEYLLRLVVIRHPLRYLKSPLGIVDLLALIPSYLSVLFVGAQSLLALRALRLLRIFRIFRLGRYLSEMNFLTQAIAGSLRKISIFMLTVLTLVVVLGSVMYLVEHRENGFSSIPESIYWAIVTITTVGYGDISPITPVGKFVASVMMLIGYAIIAVPTGIITTEMAIAAREKGQHLQVCPGCGREGHDSDANHCKYCGTML